MLLEELCAVRSVAIVIDAADQLAPTGNAWDMKWVPRLLPHNCRIVVSAAEGSTALASLRTNGFQNKRVLAVSLLTRDEQVELVRHKLAAHHKKLCEDATDFV